MAQKLSPEERAAHRAASKKKYADKQKALRAANKLNTQGTLNFEQGYMDLLAENKTLKEQIEELKGLVENTKQTFNDVCKSYAEKEQLAQKALQKATLEYNARTKYLLDCVKHAYISMQFAVNAIEDQKENK